MQAFYVDQVASIAYGVHVSKITFGISGGSEDEYPVPAVSIVMPTSNLRRFAVDIARRLGDADFKDKMREALHEALNELDQEDE
ncbi:hypothetical protein KQ306_07590 [Synechococcus sp. CS-1324]|uniref:hypothetical protein n=1 Tax=Synechococcus sp. CS-1324 TaxID=2847980 RepID=UPI00223C4C96|nr:hypothetical protein [Synechococcus sp. CS-1324]MCT0230712.1 hypothetical protein [Synechococcus sp. CS-1324]